MYLLNLFLPAPDEDIEDAFERECCLGSNESPRSQEDELFDTHTITKQLRAIEPNLSCDTLPDHVELTDPRGVQISLFSSTSAAITVPYLQYPEEVKSTSKYLREYLAIFETYRFYVQDPQTERIVPAGILIETIVQDLSTTSAYVANQLSAALGQGYGNPLDAMLSTNTMTDSFLPGICPLEFDLKPTRRSSGIQDRLYSYFSSRPNYQLILNRARYDNPDTDVSFEFDLPPIPRTSNQSPTKVVFRIDLGRPDPFAYEANIELLAFTESLSYWCADSPHTCNEPYTDKRFFDVWHRENSYAVRRFLFDGGDIGSYTCVSSALFERVWTWNQALGDMRKDHANDYLFPKLRVWRSTHLLVEGDFNCQIALPVDEVWIAIPADPHNVCVVEAGLFEATPCALHPADTAGHRIINLCESRKSQAIADSPRYPASTFPSQLVTLDNLIQQNLVDKAIQANKQSSRTCLKPPRNWE